MTRSRVLMTLSAVLAWAAVATAQAPTTDRPQPAREALAQHADDPACGRVRPTAIDAARGTETTNDDVSSGEEQSWLSQSLDQTLGAWQRLRALCHAHTRDQACCPLAGEIVAKCKSAESCVGVAGVCKELLARCREVRTGSLMLGGCVTSDAGVCGALVCSDGQRTIRVVVTPVTPPQAQRAGCCAQAVEARVVVASGLRNFIECLPAPRVVANVPACVCAKECKCCEMCKPKVVYAQPLPPMMPGASRVVPIGPQAWTGPMPAPMAMAAPMVPGVPMSIPSPPKITHAHFVTPDFDAHCERIINKGDTVILEGNVILLVRKHAQPMRIEGDRIILNVREGTFQVESAPRHAPTIFKMRTSAIEAPHCEIELFTPARATPTLPVAEQRIIQVVPVPAYEPAPGPRPR